MCTTEQNRTEQIDEIHVQQQLQQLRSKCTTLIYEQYSMHEWQNTLAHVGTTTRGKELCGTGYRCRCHHAVLSSVTRSRGCITCSNNACPLLHEKSRSGNILGATSVHPYSRKHTHCPAVVNHIATQPFLGSLDSPSVLISPQLVSIIAKYVEIRTITTLDLHPCVECKGNGAGNTFVQQAERVADTNPNSKVHHAFTSHIPPSQ